MTTRQHPALRSLLLVTALIALVAMPTLLSGCFGGGGGDKNADPAKAVPNTVPVYVEAIVRPEGKLRDDALAAARKITRQSDPEATLRMLLDKAFAKSTSGLSYEKDVKPWLGKRIALFVPVVMAGAKDVGVVVAVSDTDKAQKAIDKGIKDGKRKFSKKTYKGVDYQLDASDNNALALTDDYLLAGTDAAVHLAIDGLKGNNSLAKSDRYRNAIKNLDSNRLAFAYIDLQSLLSGLEKSDAAAARQFDQLKTIIPLDKAEPITAALLANGQRVALTGSVKNLLPGGNSALPSSDAYTRVQKQIPGDAWFALAAPNTGDQLKQLLSTDNPQIAAALGLLRVQTGFDLERDFLDWVNDIGIFVRGTKLADIGGGVIITTKDDAAAARSFVKVEGLLKRFIKQGLRPVKVPGADQAVAFRVGGLKRDVIFARGKGKVVFALGEDSAATVFTPHSTLAESSLTTRARAVLSNGLEPAGVLSVDKLLTLLDSTPLGAKVGYQKIRPYLNVFDVVSIGVGRNGDRYQGELSFGLK